MITLKCPEWARKIKSPPVFVLLIAISSTGFSQQRGSVEAYRAALNADRISREAKLDWQQSTRLSFSKDAQQEPRSSLTESQFADGAVGYLEEYSLLVGSVLNPNEVLVEGGPIHLLLRGYPTAGLATEQKVRLIGPVKFNGTYTYNSVGGALTVRVVELLKDAELKKHQDELAAAEEAKQYRTYTDSTGKFTFEGKFIEYKSGKAFIQRRDTKKVLELELSKLSRPDGDYIRNEIKARKEAAEAAKKAARDKK